MTTPPTPAAASPLSPPRSAASTFAELVWLSAAEIEKLTAERDQARQELARVREQLTAWHVPGYRHGGVALCRVDGHEWPCPHRRLLAGSERGEPAP